jgi:hypothetical protein
LEEKTHSANTRGAPGGFISLQGGGIIQESLGAIIPLQTGGFVGISTYPKPTLKSDQNQRVKTDTSVPSC